MNQDRFFIEIPEGFNDYSPLRRMLYLQSVSFSTLANNCNVYRLPGEPGPKTAKDRHEREIECLIMSEILKRGYWSLAKKFHPDIAPKGEVGMKRINATYGKMKKILGLI